MNLYDEKRNNIKFKNMLEDLSKIGKVIIKNNEIYCYVNMDYVKYSNVDAKLYSPSFLNDEEVFNTDIKKHIKFIFNKEEFNESKLTIFIDNNLTAIFKNCKLPLNVTVYSGNVIFDNCTSNSECVSLFINNRDINEITIKDCNKNPFVLTSGIGSDKFSVLNLFNSPIYASKLDSLDLDLLFMKDNSIIYGKDLCINSSIISMANGSKIVTTDSAKINFDNAFSYGNARIESPNIIINGENIKKENVKRKIR